MPFKSEKQRKWMYANDPEMAKKWEKEEVIRGKLRNLIKQEIKSVKEDNIKFSKEEMAQLHKDGKVEKGGHTIEFGESINEGTRAFLAYRKMKEGIEDAMKSIRILRKLIDDGPYNKKFSMITSELYKLEIDLEKKYRRVIPQVSKISKDKMLEKVIKVSKKDDVPGNPMKMSGEEKIKKLTYSGSVDNKGSYEIKGNKLNVIGIRPRDKGFFVRHFTMKTGFRKTNLYYDGVHWQGGKKF